MFPKQSQSFINKISPINTEIKTAMEAFWYTIPVLLGYLAIGIVFGLLLIDAGYPWILAPFMSIFIYAGAGQYAAITMFTANASLWEVATITFFINSRHMVYGLSLLEKFKGTGPYKPYLIFSLTDETYSLLTTIKVPPQMDKKKFYFYISLFDQLYWILGGIIGALIGNFITFHCDHLNFALTALFVVLLIEQMRQCDSRIPFAIAGFVSIFTMIFISKNNMLLFSLLFSVGFLLLWKKHFKNTKFSFFKEKK